MKKILLSIVAIIAVAMSANAQETITKECDLSKIAAESENTTWAWDADAKVGTFEWSTTWYNSTEAFGGFDYSKYQTLNYVAEAGTMDHFRFLIKYADGTQTIYVASVGTVSLTWAQMGVDADNLGNITSIRLSGANDGTGNVKISSLYLEGVDGGEVTTYLMPEGAVDVKALTGTNANWASSVIYPKEFAVQGQAFGDGDGSNEATHVDVSAYDKMALYVSNTSTGLALRVWMWTGSGVKTLFAQPVANEETADYTQEYLIKTPGVYVVKFGGLKDLKGVKAQNNWGATALIVEKAFVMPSTVATPTEIMKQVTTGITAPAAQTTVKAGKFLHNGRIVILNNGRLYNVAGATMK